MANAIKQCYRNKFQEKISLWCAKKNDELFERQDLQEYSPHDRRVINSYYLDANDCKGPHGTGTGKYNVTAMWDQNLAVNNVIYALPPCISLIRRVEIHTFCTSNIVIYKGTLNQNKRPPCLLNSFLLPVSLSERPIIFVWLCLASVFQSSDFYIQLVPSLVVACRTDCGMVVNSAETVWARCPLAWCWFTGIRAGRDGHQRPLEYGDGGESLASLPSRLLGGIADYGFEENSGFLYRHLRFFISSPGDIFSRKVTSPTRTSLLSNLNWTIWPNSGNVKVSAVHLGYANSPQSKYDKHRSEDKLQFPERFPLRYRVDNQNTEIQECSMFVSGASCFCCWVIIITIMAMIDDMYKIIINFNEKRVKVAEGAFLEKMKNNNFDELLTKC
uniref:Uncharacterized protein n=1 Tax=Glossina pallidipes TaxID=7398 RepID=A0A1B0A3V0_GLOPL